MIAILKINPPRAVKVGRDLISLKADIAKLVGSLFSPWILTRTIDIYSRMIQSGAMASF